MRILIVEDHPKINHLLSMFARQDHHIVVQTYSAEEGLNHLEKEHFDICITDLMLPGMQGEEFIKKVREVSDVYILVISAKINLNDRLEVLTEGADDYMTKPFSVEEVMAKLKNIEKRLLIQKPTVITFDKRNYFLYPLKRTLEYQGKDTDLTKHEFDIFFTLITHPNQIISRDQLISAFHDEGNVFDRVIDVYIKNIRKKLGDQASAPRYIKTHYGLGYEFVGEIDD